MAADVSTSYDFPPRPPLNLAVGLPPSPCVLLWFYPQTCRSFTDHCGALWADLRFAGFISRQPPPLIESRGLTQPLIPDKRRRKAKHMQEDVKFPPVASFAGSTFVAFPGPGSEAEGWSNLRLGRWIVRCTVDRKGPRISKGHPPLPPSPCFAGK